MTPVLWTALGVARLVLGVALLGALGWALAGALFGKRVDALGRLALAPVLAVSAVGTAGYLAWGLGLSLAVVIWSVMLAGALSAFAAWRWIPAPERGDGLRAALGWGGFAVVFAAIEGIWLTGSTDIFYHLAATRSLLVSNRPLVTDLIVAQPPAAGFDPTSGVWATVLAVLTRFSGLDPVNVVQWLSPLLAAIIAVSLLALVHRVVGGRARFWTMVLMLVVAYHLDFRWAPYPNRISLAFVAAALLALIAASEPGKGWLPAAGGTVFAAAGVAAVHMGSFELLAAILVIAALLALMRGGRARFHVLAVCIAALVAGGLIVLSRIGPAVPTAAGFALGNVDAQRDIRSRIPTIGFGPLSLVVPGAWLAGSILTLPGAVAVAILLVTRGLRGEGGPSPGDPAGEGARTTMPAGDIVAASIALLLPAYVWNLVAVDLVVGRFWYHVVRIAAIWPIFLGIPVGVAYTRLAERGRKSWPWQLAISVLAAGIVLTGGRLGSLWSGPRDLSSLWHSRAYDLNWTWRGGRYEAMRRLMGTDGSAVVAAPLGLSYHVVGLLPVRVIAVQSGHMPYFVEARDGQPRREAIDRLFAPSTSKGGTAAILRRYGVGWVMTWTDGEGRLLPIGARRLDDWPDILQPVYRKDRLAVFKVAPAP